MAGRIGIRKDSKKTNITKSDKEQEILEIHDHQRPANKSKKRSLNNLITQYSNYKIN